MEKKFRLGLELKYKGRYQEAIEEFRKCHNIVGKITDIDVLFNIGECSLKIGDIAIAKKMMELVVKIDPTDINALGILRKIERMCENGNEFKLADLSRDGVILDANFPITFYDIKALKMCKFMSKARTRYNLYTSKRVLDEMTEIGMFDPDHYDIVQSTIIDSVIPIGVSDQTIEDLKYRVLTEFDLGEEIKQLHADREGAWENDLSLICLLEIVRNPIRYIVTNDYGLQRITAFLYGDKPEQYYLRGNDEFKTMVKYLCETKERSIWEREMYDIIED
jgi:tetratricopeptide (TPR) repeat protein